MSMININDKSVSLESLTPEEKNSAWEAMAKRIGDSITDYVNRHPEQYEKVVAALNWAKEHPW